MGKTKRGGHPRPPSPAGDEFAKVRQQLENVVLVAGVGPHPFQLHPPPAGATDGDAALGIVFTLPMAKESGSGEGVRI